MAILLGMDSGIGRTLTARLMMSAALFATAIVLLARWAYTPTWLLAISTAAVWLVFSVATFLISQKGLQTAFETSDQALAETNHRLSAQLSKLSFLNHLSRDLAHSLELEETMQRLTERVIESINVDELAVLLFERDRRQVFLLTASGFDHEDRVVRVPFKADRGITGVAVRERTSVYVPDLSMDHREVAYRADRDPKGSLLSIPMVFEDQVVGVLNFSSRCTDAFDESDRALLLAVTHQAAMALANARLYRETLALTETDGLTGLLNRRGMDKRLNLEWEHSKRDDVPLSAIMIDIDHFKVYNDQQGHQLGDETLRRVGRLLEKKVRGTDVVARYGGEEFFVILPRTTKPQAVEVARKLRRTIEGADFEKGYLQPLGRVTISCGVATHPTDAESLEGLLKAADTALYIAKEDGRNQVRTLERA
ncbi:MAG: sensor domain-containing diguanylate cyclase [Myxococcota bacterium]